MYITVTGYFGSGSSAVLDLLSEYSCNGTGIKDNKGGYEHNTLYFPGGLFDLEDKLLLNNDIHRSDEALRTFKKEMLRLNNYNFGWYGSFSYLFGDEFEKNLNRFIEDLHPFRIKTRYYGQCSKVIFNPFKIPLQLAAKILLGRTIYKWGRQFVYPGKNDGMFVAFPSEDEFYSAAKQFVRDYLKMYQEEEKENTVFDRLLLCHNLYRMPKYFDEDFRVIRLERDVRDVYIFNNYLWKEMNCGSMYPQTYDGFVDYWKRVHECEKEISDSRILSIQFEDLIYKYEETVSKIEEHCGLRPEQHTSPRKYFNPDKSIKNTQVYKLRDVWKSEVERIEEIFPNYIYEYPYDVSTSVMEMFDDSRAERKKGLINILKRS